ncbi:hypothetical protein E2C01_075087 [Portunus trituberculatus]|uniref:Uncharacterized protein n=1 Tax=Portunus trituberculatus TaxID=210409 RepID=A0A5B7IFZ4_PORTR|nr:hypothetical protein [Portunus trituberculatus]
MTGRLHGMRQEQAIQTLSSRMGRSLGALALRLNKWKEGKEEVSSHYSKQLEQRGNAAQTGRRVVTESDE